MRRNEMRSLQVEYIAELTANPLQAHLCENESDLLLQRFNTLRVSQSHRRECAIQSA